MPDETPNQPEQPPAPQPAPAPPQSATATATKPAPTPPKLDNLPPYKVLLHNDDTNSFDHVIATLIELFTLEMPKAVNITHEANNSGLALVRVCHKELAELKRDQLISKGLIATIEPA